MRPMQGTERRSQWWICEDEGKDNGEDKYKDDGKQGLTDSEGDEDDDEGDNDDDEDEDGEEEDEDGDGDQGESESEAKTEYKLTHKRRLPVRMMPTTA